MSLDKLFAEGFLKRIPPSPQRAEKSLGVSDRYLSEARKALEIKIYDMAIIAAYSSVFHAARAILFRDGVAERSHFAIHDYLSEKHKAFGAEQIASFNMYRKLRHSVAYGLDNVVGDEDAKDAIDFAASFLKRVKEYLKKS